MLKTYRIIPLVFILFLFGFTLITVSPVFAADSAAFVECTQLKHPQQNFKQLLNKKDCFRDLARALVTGGAVAQANGADSPEQVSAANAAFLGCTKINPEGYGTGLSRAVGGKDHATYVKAMKKQRDCFMSAAGL